MLGWCFPCPNEFMKILLIADLHYALKQWDWVNQTAGKFDLVIVAGDMLDIASIVDLDVQIVVVMKYLRRIQPKVKLVVSSGNHDLNAENAAGEKTARWLEDARELGIYTDGDCFEMEDCFFTVCPWWDGPQSQAEVGKSFARDAAAAREKGRWIWVYHAPPKESPVSWDGKRDFGDEMLPKWIEEYKPEMVLGGHIHHAPLAQGGSWVDKVGESWVFNMGKQIGDCPAYIVIDTEGNRAIWSSLAGLEQVDLKADAVERLEV